MKANNLFPLKVSPDKMTAYIPAGAKISSELVSYSYEQLSAHLKSLGYARPLRREVFNELKRAITSPQQCFDDDYTVIKGRPILEARDALIKWLNPPDKPQDLVYPSLAFAIMYPARATVPSQNVFGDVIPLEPGTSEPPGKEITLNEKLFYDTRTGEISAPTGGQATLKDFHLSFSETYSIVNLKDERLHSLFFPCHVHVLCDIEPYVEWTIQGDMTVEQFWNAHKINVEGNCICNGGIQTNYPNEEGKTVNIKGNCEALFIQSSRINIDGYLKVERAITGSVICLGGNLECMGDPGRILGTEIILKNGQVEARAVGGEKDTPSVFKFLTQDGSLLSKIQTVNEGTRIQILRKNVIIQSAQPWPPPPK